MLLIICFQIFLVTNFLALFYHLLFHFFHAQRSAAGTQGTGGGEEFRMVQGIHERSAPSHGETCHGTVPFFSLDAVGGFHKGKKFIKEEILISPLIVHRVKITTLTPVGIGHHNDHGGGCPFFDGFISDMHYLSKLYPAGLVVTSTMQEVKDRIAPLGMLIIGGEVNGVVALHLENLTVHGKIVVDFAVLGRY